MKARIISLLVCFALLSTLFFSSAFAMKQMDSGEIVHDGFTRLTMYNDTRPGASFQNIYFVGRFYLRALQDTNRDYNSVTMHFFGHYHDEIDNWVEVARIAATAPINISSGVRLPTTGYFTGISSPFNISSEKEYFSFVESNMPSSIRGYYRSWISNRSDGE